MLKKQMKENQLIPFVVKKESKEGELVKLNLSQSNGEVKIALVNEKKEVISEQIAHKDFLEKVNKQLSHKIPEKIKVKQGLSLKYSGEVDEVDHPTLGKIFIGYFSPVKNITINVAINGIECPDLVEVSNNIVNKDYKEPKIVLENSQYNLQIDVNGSKKTIGIIDSNVVPSFMQYSAKNEFEIQTLRILDDKFAVTVQEETTNEKYPQYFKKAIDLGLIKEEEVVPFYQKLIDYQFSPKTIQKVVEQWRVYEDEECKAAIPRLDEIQYIDYDKYVLKATARMLTDSPHLLLLGHLSVGKNVLSKTLAAIFRRPLLQMEAINGETDKSDMVGAQTLEDNKIVFNRAQLVKAMEYGCWIEANELNYAKADVLGMLNSVTDDHKAIYVSNYKNVVAKPGFGFIATINYDTYEGTKPLNIATKTRCKVLEIRNSATISKILKSKYPKAKDSDISICIAVYEKLHERLELDTGNPLDPSVIGIRLYESALKEAEFIGIKDALLDNIGNVSCVREEIDRIRDIINSVI